jgi:hypothetical protein
MTNMHDKLERVVLQAVGNDYEEFEMIVHDATKWMSRIGEGPEIGQVEYALMKCIADRNIKAYEYSESACQFISTDADPKKINTLWFYITENGKKRLELLDTI